MAPLLQASPQTGQTGAPPDASSCWSSSSSSSFRLISTYCSALNLPAGAPESSTGSSDVTHSSLTTNASSRIFIFLQDVS